VNPGGDKIMKKGKRAALVLVLAVLLTACGGRGGGTVTTEEIVVPEMSSEDLLVDSLEYLLRDDGEASGEEEDAGSAEGTETISLILYYSNGSCDGLASQTEEAEELTADALTAALARHNIVSLDTKVLSFEEKEEEEGKVLYLDLSAEMDHYLSTMTKEAKNIIIDSITKTFLENYKADIIHIRIAGEPLERYEMMDQA